MAACSAYLLAATIFLSACGDGPGTLGKDVLPGEDIIGMKFTDTVQIEMESQLIGKVNTFRASRQLFGNYVDPQFGQITAVTYTEVLPRSGLNFGSADDLRFDSLIVIMEIDGAYGSTDQSQTLRIHELSQIIPDVNEYFSDQTLPYDQQTDLANGFTLQYDPSQEFQRFTIRLDDKLGKRILFANTDTLSDKDLFKELFKGLVFRTDPVKFFSREPGTIFLFSAGGTASRLELHYQKKDTAGVFETAAPEPFLISSSTPRFHSVERTELEGKLLDIEWNQPDDRTLLEFVQAGNLIQNYVRFPYIENLGAIGVSRAELVLNVDTTYLGSKDQFEPPVEILAILANENKEEQLDGEGFRIPIDPQTPTANYDAARGTYTFIVTDYVQRLASGQLENNGFILVPRNSSFLVNRAVLGGTSHPTLSPVLNLTFSTLPR